MYVSHILETLHSQASRHTLNITWLSNPKGKKDGVCSIHRIQEINNLKVKVSAQRAARISMADLDHRASTEAKAQTALRR
jgi:hypothetical protein